jgi:PAS domain S-box-containing protein
MEFLGEFQIPEKQLFAIGEMTMSTHLRVLLVDDAPADAESILQIQTYEGHDTFCVIRETRLVAALERASAESFELVLFDIDLPDGGGLDALPRLQMVTDAGIIVLIKEGDEQRGVTAIERGARDYLVKGRIDPLLLARFILYVYSQMRTERELRDAQEQYRTFFNSSTDMVFLKDEQLRYIHVNTPQVKFFGTSEQDILGKTDADLMPPDAAAACQASDREAIESRKTITLHEQIGDRTFEVRKFPVNLMCGAIGVGAFIRDVTERLRAEEALHESEDRYRQLFESESDAIVLIDNQTGAILEANSAASVMYGFEHDALLRLRNVDLSAEPEETQSVTHGTPVIRDNVVNIPLRYHRKRDGTVFPVEITGRFFFRQGRPVHIAAIRDISARKKGEEEMLANAELLHASIAQRDKLFSIIAHDLRSPFNTLLGNSALLIERAATMTLEQIVTMATRLNASALHMYQLLENLLEWSQIQQGLIPFAPDRFHLLPFIPDSLALVMEAAQKKSIDLRYEIPGDLEVCADRQMLQSLMRNLGSNAVKFTRRGGSIVVQCREAGEASVEISVRDTGVGIPKELLARLFCISENTKRQGTEGEHSTGLGLLLCKEFAEKHGGPLRVESCEDKGSVFAFTLPRGS